MVSKGSASSSSSGTAASSSSASSSSSSASYTILEPDPPLSGKEVDAMKEYASSLEDLFINSKPLINMLTMLAEENRASARAIVLAIELHLRKVPSEVKLPVLYLIDSIYKNVGSPYSTLFNQNIVQMFCSVFEKGDEKTRMQLFKLRQTWNQMLPLAKLYALDVHVNSFDPAWPVQQLANIIHVNPKFLQGSTTASPTPTTATPALATVAPLAAPTATTSTASDDTKSSEAASLRENLRRKQKKLLELRQKKLELELLQTKEKLREQEMLQQQQQQLATAATNVDKKQRRSSKHSSSSGSSSSSKLSSSTSSSELEKQRTRLSQQLKQELAQARLAAPVTLKTPTAPTTIPITPPTAVPHSAASATAAKVTSTSIDPSHHTTTSPLSTAMTTAKPQLPTVPATGTGTPAVTGAPVMRIAPVSSQLLSAVQKRGATRDPRLLRGTQATADSAKPVVTSLPSSKTSVTSSKSSSSTSVTSSSKSSSSSVTSSKSSSAKSVTSSPSKSSGGVTSSIPSKSTSVTSSKSTSVTSSKSNDTADELLVTSKKSRTSGGGSSQSQASSNQPRITVSVPCSVATTADVVVKSSSRSSKSSRSSSAESGGTSGKHHHHHHSKHHQEPAKMIDTVTEKDSLDLDHRKEPVDQSQQPPTELATPPAAEPQIGQLLPEPVVQAPPTSGGKRLSEERDVPPPTKKSKVMDRFDELFGDDKEKEEKEMPPAPPPPSITEAELKSPPSLTTAADQLGSPLAETDETNSSSRASGGGRWSKYKAHRQTSLSEPYPVAARTKNKDKDNKDTDRLGRPLLYRHGGGRERRNSVRSGSGGGGGGAVLEHLAEQDEYDSGGGSGEGSSGGNSPSRLVEQVGGGCSYILQQAENQFKNGSLSSTQYNQILKEMIELNELKKLDEARRKEEREHRRSRRKYRHHQKVDQSEESSVQPIGEPNKQPAAETRNEGGTVNGDNKTVDDMEISPDEDSGKESEKIRTTDEDADTKVVYEPLQPPPMPPAFVSRRSSEEEEMAAADGDGVRKEVQEEDVDIREREELVAMEGGADAKQEVVLPTKQDVDNRLGFAGIGLAALSSPTQDSSGLIVKEQFPPVPAVINSTKDIDLRIGLQRPLVIPPAPLPMETEVVESANSGAAATRNSTTRLAAAETKGGGGGGRMPPGGAWGGPQGGAPWMMQAAPLQCWGGPPGMHATNVMPLRPPPIPPPAMFEPDSNVRLCRPVGPLPPAPQQLIPSGGPVVGGPGPPAGPIDLPAADLGVLEAIADDTMKSIEIDGTPRDIRYYGNIAVVFLSWDDPREIRFQSDTPRKLIIDDRQTVTLAFNAGYQEVMIDGQSYPVRIGGPTRELYVDTQFYQVLFGGPPISVALGANDRLHKLQLEGPPPPVKIGHPRRDLCLGKITLIVDARHHYTIYLDPKAQRFDLDGVPHIIRFVQALETTVINGVPFKFEFGGLPRPIYSRGKKHYVRLTSLPQGVVPGYVDILGMEGGRRSDRPTLSRPPIHSSLRAGGPPPHLLVDHNSQSSDGGHRTPPKGDGSPRQDFLHDDRSMPSAMVDSEAALMEAPPPSAGHYRKHHSPVKVNPLDVLSTLLAPAATAPVSGFSYSLEKESTSSYQPALSTDQRTNKPKPSNPSGENLLGDLSIQELFDKLVATGIVPTASKNAVTSLASVANQSAASPGPAANQEKGGGDQSEASIDDNSHIDTLHASDKIEFVDFAKPQTLRVRQPGLIKQLYSGIQCSSCGVRFAPEQTIKYSQHLDWHFRQNRRERDSARMVHSRTWYYDLSDWTQFEEIEDIEERALSWFDTQTLGDGEGGEGGGFPDDGRGEEGAGDVPSAACESGAVDVRCALCRDRFDIFYNEDKEEWHVRRALKQANDYYHPLCWDDHLASMKTPPPEPEEPEKQEPIASITIDEDDSEEGNNNKTKEEEDGGGEVKKEEEEEDDDDVIIQEPEHKMEIIELLKDDDDEEEEERERERNKIKEDGDESSSKMSSDKKDSEDGDSLKPTDFHSILRNIKQEKIDVDALDADSGDQEVIDLDASARRREEGGDLDDDELPLINQPPPVVDTTQVKVACSIDGNVELDDSGSANMLAAPSKIKINISKVTAAAFAPAPAPAPTTQSAVSAEPPTPAVGEEVEQEEEEVKVESPPPPVFRAPPPATASMVVPLVALVGSSQPPPPGEEPVPLNLKPRLIGHKLTELQPVSRGTELSGLCSIM